MVYYYTIYNGTSEQNTQRRIEYARSKTNYQLPPSPYTVVKQSAKKFEPTDRIRSLSAPKLRTEHHLRKGINLCFIRFFSYFS
jgi:hypothetical protein